MFAGQPAKVSHTGILLFQKLTRMQDVKKIQLAWHDKVKKKNPHNSANALTDLLEAKDLLNG